jgi:2-oxoisovalerate dehydrogenase E2 component (dihydrolipoyl transacylase)
MPAMKSLNMPDVGESVTEGTVTRWLKHEGDVVRLDDLVVEIETEKVEVEVPSPFEGRLVRILVQEGETALVGAPLAEFETESGAGALPAAPALSAPAGIATAPAAPVSDGVVAAAASASVAPELHRTRQHSPVVLKLAAEHGIDLALVQGTGIEGRVTRQDVMRYVENPAAHTVAPSPEEGVVGVSAPAAAPRVGAQPAAPAVAPAPASAPAPALAPDDELVPLSPTRRTIAARMLDSHRSMPVAWMAVEADVTELVRLRDSARERFLAEESVALTYLPFFVQAIVVSLKQHPALNATFTDDGVRVHHRLHIGVAVATEGGLIVPVLRDADRKSIAGLARDIADLGARARERKLTIEDVRGATLTVDNTGAFGSILSQPIIPPGQAAIITTEAIRGELRVAADGSFAARSVMNLCISFDHRALDGAQAGAFMQSVRTNLEAYRAGQPLY